MLLLLDSFPLFFATFGLTAGQAGLLAAGLGAATSIYGANKAAAAQEEAIKANKAAQDEANRLNYQRWLESQGVGPDGQPINTWLPRYAMVSRPTQVPEGFGLFTGGQTPTFTASNVTPTGVPTARALVYPSTAGLGGSAGGGGVGYGDLLNGINNQGRKVILPPEAAP